MRNSYPKTLNSCILQTLSKWFFVVQLQFNFNEFQFMFYLCYLYLCTYGVLMCNTISIQLMFLSFNSNTTSTWVHPVFSEIHVVQLFVFCVMFCRSLYTCTIVLFHLTIVLSILLFTAYDYPFGILKLVSLNIEYYLNAKDVINNENRKYCILLKWFHTNYVNLYVFRFRRTEVELKSVKDENTALQHANENKTKMIEEIQNR